MVHHFSPFVWRIDGDFGIRWYGLAYLTTFVLSYLLIRWLARRQNTGLSSQHVLDFVTTCAIGALLGGRLGYCLFYNMELLFKVKPEFPFWGVLALSEGGMDSQGGIIGVVIACLWFAQTRSLNKLYLFDLVGVCGTLGLVLGRMTNFINGEFLGRPCAADFPLAMKFPSEIYQWPKVSPERLADLASVVTTMPGDAAAKWTEWITQFSNDPVVRNQMNQALMAIVEQIQNGNTATRDALAPLLAYRFPYQLIAAVLEGGLLFLIVWIFWHKPRKAGLVGALALLGFGAMTLVTSQFRQPDLNAGLQLVSLRQNHFAVIDMMIGAGLFLLWSRSGSVVIPGWRRVQSIRINRRV